MQSTVGSRAIHEFRQIIQQEVERLMEAMASGALESYDQYRMYAGRIAGLRSSLSAMEEAESIAMKSA